MLGQRGSAVGRWSSLVAMVSLATATGGCVVFGARAEHAAAPLDVPEAPPRVVSEFPSEVAAPDAEAARTPSEAPGAEDESTRPDGGPSRPEARVAPVPERAETEPVAVGETPVETERAPLQLSPRPEPEFDVGDVRGGLARTASLLSSVDRVTLDSAGRVRYDTAGRFLDQAAAALRADSVMFAHYLIQKAEVLALSLQ